eukprot:COSAG02_NODE_19838_length_862_cov_1.129751_1_plen_127_part_10
MIGETASDLTAIMLLRDLQVPGTSPLKQPDVLASASPEQPQGSLLEFAAACKLENFAICEALLEGNSAGRLVTSTTTLADLIIFNMLSEVYGNATFRRLFGSSFGLCFPKLCDFYHSMLSHAPLRDY